MHIAPPSSTRPYLIRALHEWCTENGFTPYIAVAVNEQVQVPREYVKEGEIVLNVSLDATTGLKLGNEFVEFKGRFAGVAREVIVPIMQVMAIYARENGQGMVFPIEAKSEEPAGVTAGTAPGLSSVETAEPPTEPQPPRPASKRPALKRVK